MRLVVAFVLVLCAIPAHAANVYVYQSAAGSNNGTDWTNAYTSFPSMSNIARGDTVYLADTSSSLGSITFNKANSGTTAITIKKATIADHGTATGWSDTMGDGQATFNSWTITTDYWTLDGQSRPTVWQGGSLSTYGLKVGGSSCRTVRLDDGVGNAGDNLTFKYVDFTGVGRDNASCAGSGDNIYGLGGSQNVTIQYSAIHDANRVQFLSRDGWTNWLVEYTYIARNSSFPTQCGGHGEMISITEGTNLTFRYNIIEDAEGTAVFAGLNGGTISGLYIYGNVIKWTAAYNADSGRSSCGGESHNPGVSGVLFIANDVSNNNFGNNVKFFNNVVYDLDLAGEAGLIIQNDNSLGGNEVRNNMWYSIGVGATHDVDGGTFSNNWYYQSTTDDGGSPTTCTVSCAVFTDPANNDFHLTAAVSGGTSLSSPYNQDPDGNTRGADGTWDRGAFEYVAGGGGGGGGKSAARLRMRVR